MGGDYVTPARRAALSALGKLTSYAEASRCVVLDAAGNSPVANALKRRRSSGHGRLFLGDDDPQFEVEDYPQFEPYTPRLTTRTPRLTTRTPPRAASAVDPRQARRRSADSWLEKAMHRLGSDEVRAPACYSRFYSHFYCALTARRVLFSRLCVTLLAGRVLTCAADVLVCVRVRVRT